jgi:NADH:ubiquinone oxidoreductase subunit 4 (subunit M)
VILAGILLKLGGYGFIRFCCRCSRTRADVPALVFALSDDRHHLHSLVAFRQTDIKKLIAYSLGGHMASSPSASSRERAGAAGRHLPDAQPRADLGAHCSCCVGVIYDRMHTREIAFYGGLATRMPLYATVFLLFTMGNVGLPGTSGFVGEVLTMTGTYQVSSTGRRSRAVTGIILSPSSAQPESGAWSMDVTIPHWPPLPTMDGGSADLPAAHHGTLRCGRRAQPWTDITGDACRHRPWPTFASKFRPGFNDPRV